MRFVYTGNSCFNGAWDTVIIENRQRPHALYPRTQSQSIVLLGLCDLLLLRGRLAIRGDAHCIVVLFTGFVPATTLLFSQGLGTLASCTMYPETNKNNRLAKEDTDGTWFNLDHLSNSESARTVYPPHHATCSWSLRDPYGSKIDRQVFVLATGLQLHP